jgi:excisionase family DNA binding protein
MELLTVQEAAHLLRVSTVTVRRYIADGSLPAFRIGRGIRIKRESIDALASPIATGSAEDSRLKHRPTGDKDPLWNIVGMAAAANPSDVGRHKHEYLAEAYHSKSK